MEITYSEAKKPVRLKDYVQHIFDPNYEKNLEERIYDGCLKHSLIQKMMRDQKAH